MTEHVAVGYPDTLEFDSLPRSSNGVLVPLAQVWLTHRDRETSPAVDVGAVLLNRADALRLIDFLQRLV